MRREAQPIRPHQCVKLGPEAGQLRSDPAGLWWLALPWPRGALHVPAPAVQVKP